MASYQYGSMRSTTSARHSVRGRTSGGSAGVARVVELRVRVVLGERRRRRVVGAAPQHELLLAELGEGLGLVLALQRAVVPLVEPPRAAHRDPHPIGRVERQLGGADRPPLQRRVHDVGEQAVLDEQLAAACRLGHPLLGQVDVDPPGEQVLAGSIRSRRGGAARASATIAAIVGARLGRIPTTEVRLCGVRGMVGAMSITNDDIKAEWADRRHGRHHDGR